MEFYLALEQNSYFLFHFPFISRSIAVTVNVSWGLEPFPFFFSFSIHYLGEIWVFVMRIIAF